MKKVSVAIAAYNEEGNLDRCLASVADWVDELVIVDGGSTDKTVEVARRYGARIIETDNPAIFHINKQKAVDACTGDWILQLDTDEVVSSDLRKEITDTISSKHSRTGYYIPRKNYLLNHWLRKGGQYPDYVIRFFRWGKGRFPCKSVHEQIEIDGDVGYLQSPLLHYSYRTLAEYWKKSDAYTSLTAQEMVKNKIPKTIISWIWYEWITPTWKFLSLYIRHKGFVDGVYGLLFAFFSALHYPIAYKKYLRMK